MSRGVRWWSGEGRRAQWSRSGGGRKLGTLCTKLHRQLALVLLTVPTPPSSTLQYGGRKGVGVRSTWGPMSIADALVMQGWPPSGQMQGRRGGSVGTRGASEERRRTKWTGGSVSPQEHNRRTCNHAGAGTTTAAAGPMLLQGGATALARLPDASPLTFQHDRMLVALKWELRMPLHGCDALRRGWQATCGPPPQRATPCR